MPAGRIWGRIGGDDGGRIGAKAALAHADFGSGDEAADAATAGFLSEVLPGLMAPKGVIVSDQPLNPKGWAAQPLPDGVPEDRYFIFQAG